MKRIYPLLFLALASLTSGAVVRTVCNMPYSPGQFTTIAAAMAVCNNNDTLYVHGSSITYGNVNFTRSGIVLIGAGHNPNKQAPLPTLFQNINTGSFTNCQIIGVSCQTIFFGGTGTVIKRCKFSDISPGPCGISIMGPAVTFVIEGNIFSHSMPGNMDINFGNTNASGSFVRNNIFSGVIVSNSSITTPNTFLITNNIFIGNNPFSFSSIFNASINNNIFFRSCPVVSGGTGNAMNHNISFNCSNNTFSVAGSNNLTNVNPVFVNPPVGMNPFAYTNDFRLGAGSPGLLSGNDGTDRGVFGGTGFAFNMTGEPAMAEVTTFNITSPVVVAPGGTLNINVVAKRIQ